MNTQSDTIIEVSHLVKTYGALRAVDDITFSVHENEIFGLLGPNGAGKTTTLEIIETLKPKTSGEVIIGGHSISESPELIKSMIGVQLQAAGYPAFLTLREILQLFADLYNVSIRPDDLLAQVQLKDKANAKIKELSGGQKQRFSISTTLVHKPPIIFLDEPSTGLDPQARRNLWDLIQNIRKEGTTVVITTHFMDEAEELCDRVAIMDEGKIISMGNPDTLVEELLTSGFKNTRIKKEATLEDVFINLTGKDLRE